MGGERARDGWRLPHWTTYSASVFDQIARCRRRSRQPHVCVFCASTQPRLTQPVSSSLFCPAGRAPPVTCSERRENTIALYINEGYSNDEWAISPVAFVLVQLLRQFQPRWHLKSVKMPCSDLNIFHFKQLCTPFHCLVRQQLH